MFTLEELQMKYLALSSLMVLALLGLTLSGCGSADSTSSTEPDGTNISNDQGHETQEHVNSGKTDMEKMKAALAEMDPEDAASAEKQHICPVSGEMLGTMGVPQKVTVNGQSVWICCDGCRDKLLADPDKYLAKLQHGH
jgi:hypothetical protein